MRFDMLNFTLIGQTRDVWGKKTRKLKGE